MSDPSVKHQSCTDLALAKAKVVEPLRGLRPIPSATMIEACRAAAQLLNSEVGEISHQTIRNWLKILETEGPNGLERKARKDRGKTTISPQMMNIVRGILLHPKRFSVAETHRRVERYARHFLNTPEAEIPTRKQIVYLWEHIPDEDKLLAFEGINAYRRKYDQAVRFEAECPNAIWQADHHQLDIIVIDPDTKAELGRPWITKIQDDHSRAVVGYYLSMDHPSSMSIASAMYHAFLPKSQDWWVMYGLPKMLYIDHGKDWISRHIEAVALKFNIKLQPHESYHPQSKGKIERLFRTLEEMCIHPLDGSVGSNIQQRPQRVVPTLSLAQVRVHIERFIRDYNERVHGTTRQNPRERWLNSVGEIRRIENLADIDYLLKSKGYTVQKDGIHFQSGRYLDQAGVLGGYTGRRVTVFFDTRDTERIRVWGRRCETDDIQYLCTAYLQSQSAHCVTQTGVAEQNKRRRDATRTAVRDAQKAGTVALNALEAQREAAHGQEGVHTEKLEAAPLQAGPTDGVLPEVSAVLPVQPQPTASDEEVEIDYDALRRMMLRKQLGA